MAHAGADPGAHTGAHAGAEPKPHAAADAGTDHYADHGRSWRPGELRVAVGLAANHRAAWALMLMAGTNDGADDPADACALANAHHHANQNAVDRTDAAAHARPDAAAHAAAHASTDHRRADHGRSQRRSGRLGAGMYGVW